MSTGLLEYLGRKLENISGVVFFSHWIHTPFLRFLRLSVPSRGSINDTRQSKSRAQFFLHRKLERRTNKLSVTVAF